MTDNETSPRKFGENDDCDRKTDVKYLSQPVSTVGYEHMWKFYENIKIMMVDYKSLAILHLF